MKNEQCQALVLHRLDRNDARLELWISTFNAQMDSLDHRFNGIVARLDAVDSRLAALRAAPIAWSRNDFPNLSLLPRRMDPRRRGTHTKRAGMDEDGGQNRPGMELRRELHELRRDTRIHFCVLFAAVVTMALSLAGLMAKGLGWLWWAQ